MIFVSYVDIETEDKYSRSHNLISAYIIRLSIQRTREVELTTSKRNLNV